MSNSNKRDQFKICREEWFKDHKAVIIAGTSGDPATTSNMVIEWRKPTSWNYAIRFIIHSQWLCVVGDCGEATYQWSENITLKFLGSLNFDYFHGKCRASEVGSKFVQFDARRIQSFKKEMSPREWVFVNEQLAGGCQRDEVERILTSGIDNGRITCRTAGPSVTSSVCKWPSNN
jgi:hypothetical protein